MAAMKRVEREARWAQATAFQEQMNAEPGRWLPMPMDLFTRGPGYAPPDTAVASLDPWMYDVYLDDAGAAWARRKPRPKGLVR